MFFIMQKENKNPDININIGILNLFRISKLKKRSIFITIVSISDKFP